ncbi:sulfotransferase domain-containing protein [Thalassomonas actiniarum]|uniref:Sulfotransferase domain-containing protein n=1 Tax=Thalassomonas actiniarum TaxID=485447 RepID=A0AAE9YZ94_9GAMM|nr:sulfotransferase domain-containing protein [Thalassomonas actiniarum]WDE02357.1 sulfotransferase domain-containing protein [Thalassomonas actiniarum]
MLADKKSLPSDRSLKKFFRAFELSTEYRERKYFGKSLFHKPSQLILGFIEYQFLSYYFARVPGWRLFLRRLYSKDRIAPNYVVIGPMKNGSSDLVTHLQMHPNVMHPLAKEIASRNVEQVKLHYPTIKEKQRLEEQSQHPVRCGYLKPELNNMGLMDHLYELNPQSKIIITLRDPVSRAYTHWKWEVFLGGEFLRSDPHFETFEQYAERALDLFPSLPMKTACGFPPLQTGIYYQAVEKWINRFGRENVLILDSAEYFLNRQPTLERVQEFLELPIVDIPEYGDKANENPIKLPPANQKTKSMLAEFYKPYNQKLFDLLGQEFDWQ